MLGFKVLGNLGLGVEGLGVSTIAACSLVITCCGWRESCTTLNFPNVNKETPEQKGPHIRET